MMFLLQHLVWILGLKPAVGGALKPGRAVEGPSTVSYSFLFVFQKKLLCAFCLKGNSGRRWLVCSRLDQVLTTAVMTDLPVISNILSRLFESSQWGSVLHVLFLFFWEGMIHRNWMIPVNHSIPIVLSVKFLIMFLWSWFFSSFLSDIWMMCPCIIWSTHSAPFHWRPWRWLMETTR